MDVSIGAGLGIFGNLINNNKNYKIMDDTKIPKFVNNTPTNFYSNFESDIWNNRDKVLYTTISDTYKESEKPNTNIVNNIWRIQNDTINQKKNKEILGMMNKDINMIKNIETNNIETMKNINELNSNDSDSVFSDNFSLPKYIPQKKNNQSRHKDNITNGSNSTFDYYDNDPNKSIDSDYSDDSNYSNDSNYPNKYNKKQNIQNKYLEDVISNLSGKSNGYYKTIDDNNTENCDSLSRQFDQLEFNHKGIPGTLPQSRQVLHLFNDKLKFNPQSNFNPKSDGRYGVTSDMTHDNMQPFFKSKTYGFNPEFEKEQTNYAVRKVELFTGSDQNPQFKHKTDVPYLFPPEIGKVESVTGVPNFSDFFESRVIPSDKRQGEKPFQPTRVTPGLNLGYNELGNTGFQDLYRALPKNVDQLRTVDNPKVSYQPPVIQGQMGDRRGAIGDFIQKGPDRFYEQTTDSFMPQKGDFIAPAIYGKHLKTLTQRSLNPDTPHLNPAKMDVDHSTPEYLQGQFKKTFKRTFDYDGPRNIQENTRGQIINQGTYVPTETQRQDTNWGDKILLGTVGNKQQDYLANYENFTPETTLREMMPELDKTNVKGNFVSVPLTNYMNFIPETTLKQILIEDEGKRNLTNVSNSVKSYLYNSINAIPDETLRSLLTEKVILTNVRENSERGYLFNNQNAIQDPNMRNLSEDNLILGVLSNKEQGYLFNNLNAIPDPTLRNLINTLYQRGGYGFKGNHEENYNFNYENSIPNTTLRDLTQDQKYIVGAQGNHVENYAFNYENGVPNTNLRNLTEDQKYIVGTQGNHVENYAFNYENGVPNTNLRNITQDQKYIIGTQGNHVENYAFNYENSTPNTTLRNLTENQKYIVGTQGNHIENYTFNYENGTPNTTLRNLTQDQKYLVGTQGNHVETFAFNYENGTPNTTMRQLSGAQKNITGTHGNRGETFTFNYENATPDTTMRQLSGAQKNITGTQGNKLEQYAFNYENGTPQVTMRQMSGAQKNMIGTKGNFAGQTNFNYKNGIPDATMRVFTGPQKNITGTQGDGTQSRSRLDANNAYLNTIKEVVAEGRDPVPVKENRGPTTQFTQYVFCDDSYFPKQIYGGTRPLTSVQNDLYTFSDH